MVFLNLLFYNIRLDHYHGQILLRSTGHTIYSSESYVKILHGKW